MDSANKPLRPWQEIAEEAAREKDPNRLLELSKQLERALEERDKHLNREIPAKAKSA
jgi:hypothetical protein